MAAAYEPHPDGVAGELRRLNRLCKDGKLDGAFVRDACQAMAPFFKAAKHPLDTDEGVLLWFLMDTLTKDLNRPNARAPIQRETFFHLLAMDPDRVPTLDPRFISIRLGQDPFQIVMGKRLHNPKAWLETFQVHDPSTLAAVEIRAFDRLFQFPTHLPEVRTWATWANASPQATPERLRALADTTFRFGQSYQCPLVMALVAASPDSFPEPGFTASLFQRFSDAGVDLSAYRPTFGRAANPLAAEAWSTPLGFAVQHGHVDMAQRLLNLGVELNPEPPRNAQGQTIQILDLLDLDASFKLLHHRQVITNTPQQDVDAIRSMVQSTRAKREVDRLMGSLPTPITAAP